MTIQPCLVPQYLPNDFSRLVRVVRPDRTDAFQAIRREVEALVREEMIEGEVNKHGYLRYVRLTVPIEQAMKVVRRYRRPLVLNPYLITRPIQNAKHWKQRADMAHLGRAGGAKTLHVGIGR